MEPYGSYGVGTGSKPLTTFDDHGILENITKVDRKDETHDGGNDVHKLGVNILLDSSSQTILDVLHQVIILPYFCFLNYCSRVDLFYIGDFVCF